MESAALSSMGSQATTSAIPSCRKQHYFFMFVCSILNFIRIVWGLSRHLKQNFTGASFGPMPKPKQYLDPRAHRASIAEMAKEIARRKKEVISMFFIENWLLLLAVIYFKRKRWREFFHCLQGVLNTKVHIKKYRRVLVIF